MFTPRISKPLVVALAVACALGGCGKSKNEARAEIIECGGFRSKVPDSLSSDIYRELIRIDIKPVAIQPIPALAGSYTHQIAGWKERWSKGEALGQELADRGDVAGIAIYLKSCVAALSIAVGS